MIMNIDVAPTMLDLAGVKPYVKLHGQSFVPLLKDPTNPGRKSMLNEYFTEKVGPRVQDWQSVRTDHWKYIHYPTLPGSDELYDLRADPNEWNNIIHASDIQEALKDLQSELTRLLTETGAPRAGL